MTQKDPKKKLVIKRKKKTKHEPPRLTLQTHRPGHKIEIIL
jgi:hypothetical protein